MRMKDTNCLVDIHQHIVFGVDDGAKSLDMSLDMVRSAAEQRVSVIACTAHTSVGRHEVDAEKYNRHFSELEERIMVNQIPVRLMRGAEIMYTEKTLKAIRTGSVPCLGNGRYVLVEFMPNATFELIRSAVGELTYNNIGVVLAHTERYSALNDLSRIEELKEAYGAVIQMNASTVFTAGRILPFSGVRIHRMLREQIVDIVASDAHDTKNRVCNMHAAFDFLCAKYGEECALKLCRETPLEILDIDG